MKARILITIIPSALVWIPFFVAWIRQSLYYRGCMDGFGYLIGAMYGFMIGGVLNLLLIIGTLALLIIGRRSSEPRKPAILTLVIGLLTLGLQILVAVAVRNNWRFY